MMDNASAASLRTDDGLYYHMLMMESGQHKKFDAALDDALETENPLSDLVLDMASCTGDMNHQLSIIKERLLHTNVNAIDHSRVFDRVSADLRELYEMGRMPLNDLAWLMYTLAWNSGWWMEKLWRTMYSMDDYYNLVGFGVIRQDDFEKTLEAILYDKQEIDPMGRFHRMVISDNRDSCF